MMKGWLSFVLLSVVGFFSIADAGAARIKDVADIAGVRSNHLVGYGLVVGSVSYTHLTLPTKRIV